MGWAKYNCHSSRPGYKFKPYLKEIQHEGSSILHFQILVLVLFQNKLEGGPCKLNVSSFSRPSSNITWVTVTMWDEDNLELVVLSPSVLCIGDVPSLFPNTSIGVVKRDFVHYSVDLRW